ncbi:MULTISPECIES: F0F1 ATP synthase subunit A [Alicyclobacillus]|uniref:ATP synthase subunit a n=1 Tax=Alicyclobacillus acidoterrestris (strain ATCC 49025 / DSM 3922 / CIP 106132 / NCIMB 13137 / GD3B) TaxID=1356854 RepID=T0BXP7_ALIAG|nr:MULTISPECIES: F0F1 ATP synthase subunit A [Alicyclobacillus]EPZ45539.1 ATP synthase F0 subunit A [Alicyclobacillus acidoterrestris ATCC 49025]UNO49509.1 F0F1 ATP synthase subunit A [Alicyclobacillus acidoterrestris]GEO24745.1 F0F1 ATP synthase subunit A [Alicyclobacillus acidoterrestris]
MPAFPTLFAGTIWQTNFTVIATIFFTGLVMFILLRIAVARMDMRRPRGLQNLMEWAAEFTTNMARETMPTEQSVRFVLPLAFTMLLFLFIANWLGLIMTISVHFGVHAHVWGLKPSDLAGSNGDVELFDSPTSSMSMALGIAVMVWVISHARGLRHPKQWFKHFYSPSPLAVIEEITNPLTHGMRLYGNIFAGEALLGIMLKAPFAFHWLPWQLPLIVLWLLYSGFVATIQAYVFSILMCLYIGNKSFEGHANH